MSKQETSAATPKVVRTTRQFEIGDGLHIVQFKTPKETVIMEDAPGRTFANLPTMTIEEAESAVNMDAELPEQVRANVIGRLQAIRKRKRVEEWSVSREELCGLVNTFGEDTATKIVYHAVRYYHASFVEIGAPVPHMENADADKALQLLIRQQYETGSEVAR